MHKVKIYTDGACIPNPGNGGWAALLIDVDTLKSKAISGGEPNTTNNRMELIAAIQGLWALKQRCIVELYSDSRYLIDGVTNWSRRWIKEDFVGVKNADLWREIIELNSIHNIHWHWVKGHAGDEFNEFCDKLATERAENKFRWN